MIAEIGTSGLTYPLNEMNTNVGFHENPNFLIMLNSVISTEAESRHEMSVPNDVVGSVIGKRGSKINEIRQIRYLIAKHDFLILGSKETSLCRSGATINIMESGQKRRERSPEPGPLVRWEQCNESLGLLPTQSTFSGSGKNHRDNRQY